MALWEKNEFQSCLIPHTDYLKWIINLNVKDKTRKLLKKKHKGKSFWPYEKQGFLIQDIKISIKGFPGGAVVKNLPADAAGTGSSPGLGRSHMPRSN